LIESLWVVVTIAVGLLGGLFLVFEVSYRLGNRRKGRGEGVPEQLGTVQGAVLGLLGLLLGFSFAGAASRFIDRQDLIVREANAIGTAYLRADLLTEPHRTQLRESLRKYTAARITLFETLNPTQFAALRADSEALHAELWAPAVAGVKAAPSPITGRVIPAVNEVIDRHPTRLSAINRHLPLLVLEAVIGCAAVGIATVGYGSGLTGRPNRTLSAALTLLIAAVVWVTIDMDYPRRGMIRISQEPMTALHDGMK
jgi:hypothetical protein